MARRKRLHVVHVLVPLTQAIICAAGLVGGLTIGAVILYLSNLWSALDRVLITPPGSLTIIDLALGISPFVIVAVCSWVGVRLGMAFAYRIDF